jgi:hypothetical protein
MGFTTGTFVISLDFELIWGVRDLDTDHNRETLPQTRLVVPRLLKLFQKYEIHATWATVGFLFFENRSELLSSLPVRFPAYVNAPLSPYSAIRSEVGENEDEDSLHYAPSLIRQIISTPYQELATHTFSHYYCLEEGQTVDDFDSDLRAAVKAAEKYNCKIESIVFPRNQYDDSCLKACASNGLLAFRGNESVWFRRSSKRQDHRHWTRRIMRLADAYINISGSNAYPIPVEKSLPINLPASRYLRSYSNRLKALEPLRLQRVISAMTKAALMGQVFHLWWHPEDFSKHMDENFSILERILVKYKELQGSYGMQSLNMGEIAHLVLDR